MYINKKLLVNIDSFKMKKKVNDTKINETEMRKIK